MGAWGAKSFENDDAMDWAAELEKSADQTFVEKGLRQALERRGKYLEAPDAGIGLAAAEVVAALAGLPFKALLGGVAAWVTNQKRLNNRSLLNLAVEMVQRVRNDSELKELWEEAGAEDWNNALINLDARLREAASNLPS